MNLSQFNRILRQVFLLPVIALLLTAGALYWQIRGANATVELIQESDARIAQATLVAKLIVDEESGLRDTRRPGHSASCSLMWKPKHACRLSFASLDEIAGSNPEQKRLIEDLRNEQQTWRDAFAIPVIATVQAGGQSNDVELNLQGK